MFSARGAGEARGGAGICVDRRAESRGNCSVRHEVICEKGGMKGQADEWYLEGARKRGLTVRDCAPLVATFCFTDSIITFKDHDAYKVQDYTVLQSMCCERAPNASFAVTASPTHEPIAQHSRRAAIHTQGPVSFPLFYQNNDILPYQRNRAHWAISSPTISPSIAPDFRPSDPEIPRPAVCLARHRTA